MSGDFIHEMFQFIDSRDWASLKEKFCEDVVYERPGYEPIKGLDDLLTFYSKVRIIAAGKHHLSHIVVNESTGASWGRFIGEGKDSSPLDERFADVYTFMDGKIKHRTSYFFRAAI